MKLLDYHGIVFLLLIVMGILTGCGGGSGGTGTTVERRLIEGTVVDEVETPVVGAEVTILDTGDTTITGDLGNFSFESEINTASIQLEVKTPGFEAVTRVEIGDNPNQGIALEITVNSTLQEIEVDELEVEAKIVGVCDFFFENRRTIRQSNEVPKGGVDCTARITVSALGTPLSQVPVGIEYKRCAANSRWMKLAESSTLGPPNSGVAQIQFRFFDDRTHCVYRIRAPFEVPRSPEIVYKVDTFTKQNLDRQ
ncbi:carboxypeptidase-like regulatory domain-containing protein [bacterium]|nr:carboxypeptidase-like regulatory domain-containing protein [bacterium]